MPQYKVQYIHGPNLELKVSHVQTVDAPSFQEALAGHTEWPIVENYDHTSACAENPGTCVYYTEAWEALLLPEKGTSPK